MAHHGTRSPSRKRARLSSPMYGDSLDDLDHADFAALDQLEFRFSQKANSSSQTGSSSGSQEAKAKRLEAITITLSQEEARQRRLRAIKAALGDKPTDSPGVKHHLEVQIKAGNTNSGFASASAHPAMHHAAPNYPSFSTASNLHQPAAQQSLNNMPSPSPEEPPPEPDFTTWFEPAPVEIGVLPGFQSVSAISLLDKQGTISSDLTSGCPAGQLPGFSKVSVSAKLPIAKVIQPSEAALAEAAKKIQSWVEELDSEETPSASQKCNSPARPVLGAIGNVHDVAVPQTPSPAGSTARKAALGQVPPKGAGNKRGFKSPLTTAPPNKSVMYPRGTVGANGSPLNPHRGFQTPSQNMRPHPLASTTLSTSPEKAMVTFNSELASTPAHFVTPMKRAVAAPPKAKFSTPFKLGMKPGEAGRQTLEQGNRARQAAKDTTTTVVVSARDPTNVAQIPLRTRMTFFNLGKVPDRKTLLSSGLMPQRFTAFQLGCMGVNVHELKQINIKSALFYSFHSDTAEPPSSSYIILAKPHYGSSAALEQLLAWGCDLATEDWVNNHWSLILWKLAGMACLEPERELKDGRRWCWGEVMRQLLYRYERELNQGCRPAFKLITTHDAPASLPMVLCVSDITWSGWRTNGDGGVVGARPEIEVTDGWYRLRAEVDETLIRAIQRGSIKIGRKLAVAGARLHSSRKDPAEILHAFESTKLVLSGNSTRLAPWHAKLGFHTRPYIATLGALTGDGGLVAVMKLTILKVYPIAYIEFKEVNGRTLREGPRCASEEAEADEKWKNQREVAESKLRDDLEKKWAIWEGYADRLERLAGPSFNPKDDEIPPDHIEDLFDEFEGVTDVGTHMKRLSSREAGWLAEFLRSKCNKDREFSRDEIEMELKSICPAREVRNFRVVVVEDAETHRRRATRKAQLTVWDVLSLSFSEGGGAGVFDEGQTFLVTNLMPSQPRAWMTGDGDSEIYLSTRRDTRWSQVR